MIRDELWIFGAGDLARLAKFFFEKELDKPVSGFIVDEEHLAGVPRDLGQVVTWQEYLERVPRGRGVVFPAIGYRSMRAREAVFDRLEKSQQKICNLVCQSAKVASDVELGVGVFVMPGVVIEPGVVVGSNNVLWSNSTVCHDSMVGEHNFIAANAVIGGRAHIGSRCFFGFSSVVGQDVRVCSDVLLGATAFLKGSVEGPGVYLGSPAIKRFPIDSSVGVSVFP
jgi:sugar O-acyltransferase (sialic acid O-acetyltransferase NeuD family)